MALKYQQATYKAPTYTSQYGSQLNAALNNVTNFSYDPLQDASYQALAKVYNANGRTAANDTMGQAAALNGGYGSSYATTAAAQARNSYNQQLAALIPDLEQNAYSRANNTLSALQNAENQSYNRYRDNVSDAQWQYSNQNANNQWLYEQQQSQNRWQQEMSENKRQFNKNYSLQKKSLNSSNSGSTGGSNVTYSYDTPSYGTGSGNAVNSAAKAVSAVSNLARSTGKKLSTTKKK